MSPTCLFPFDERSDTCQVCGQLVLCRRTYRRLREPPKLERELDLLRSARGALIDRATDIAVRLAGSHDYVCGPDVQDECRKDPEFCRLWDDLSGLLGDKEPDWRFLGAVFRREGVFVPYLDNGHQVTIRVASHSRPAACWSLARRP